MSSFRLLQLRLSCLPGRRSETSPHSRELSSELRWPSCQKTSLSSHPRTGTAFHLTLSQSRNCSSFLLNLSDGTLWYRPSHHRCLYFLSDLIPHCPAGNSDHPYSLLLPLTRQQPSLNHSPQSPYCLRSRSHTSAWLRGRCQGNCSNHTPFPIHGS